MKLIFYLAIALAVFWIIKNVLTSKNKSIGGKMKVTGYINGKPVKTPKDIDEQMRKHEESFLRVDPYKKNDGLDIDIAEKVAWDRNEKIYKMPDGMWFIVYHRSKGERTYQRMTPWEVRNFIKYHDRRSEQDSEALLIKHNLTGTKDELHYGDIPKFVARKYIEPDQ